MKDSPMHDTSTTAIRSARLSALRTQMLAEAEITSVQNQSLIQSRREQICEAALSLFLEKGFAATTIRDICARSGVNQASIYDYIANKNDILRRLLNQLWFREDGWARERDVIPERGCFASCHGAYLATVVLAVKTSG